MYKFINLNDCTKLSRYLVDDSWEITVSKKSYRLIADTYDTNNEWFDTIEYLCLSNPVKAKKRGFHANGNDSSHHNVISNYALDNTKCIQSIQTYEANVNRELTTFNLLELFNPNCDYILKPDSLSFIITNKQTGQEVSAEYRAIKHYGEVKGKLFLHFGSKFMYGNGSIYFDMIDNFTLSKLQLAIQNRIIAIYTFLKSESLKMSETECLLNSNSGNFSVYSIKKTDSIDSSENNEVDETGPQPQQQTQKVNNSRRTLQTDIKHNVKDTPQSFMSHDSYENQQASVKNEDSPPEPPVRTKRNVNPESLKTNEYSRIKFPIAFENKEYEMNNQLQRRQFKNGRGDYHRHVDNTNEKRPKERTICDNSQLYVNMTNLNLNSDTRNDSADEQDGNSDDNTEMVYNELANSTIKQLAEKKYKNRKNSENDEDEHTYNSFFI